MVELDRLWSIADEALAKARALPWGPERIDALKEAARLRNEAANMQMETGEFRSVVSEKRKGVTRLDFAIPVRSDVFAHCQRKSPGIGLTATPVDHPKFKVSYPFNCGNIGSSGAELQSGRRKHPRPQMGF